MGEPPPLHETVCALCLGSVLWVLEWYLPSLFLALLVP